MSSRPRAKGSFGLLVRRAGEYPAERPEESDHNYWQEVEPKWDWVRGRLGWVAPPMLERG